MTTRIILTVIGSDRPGLTDALAAAVLAAGGNWLESHLHRLGGKYVGSVLVEIAEAGIETLRSGVAAVDAIGLKVELVPAGDAEPLASTLAVALVGQDRPGIVREFAAALAPLGVNIEAMRTGVEAGAWSGAPLFRADAELRLPAGIDAAAVRRALEGISAEIMVDMADGQ